MSYTNPLNLPMRKPVEFQPVCKDPPRSRARAFLLEVRHVAAVRRHYGGKYPCKYHSVAFRKIGQLDRVYQWWEHK